MRRLYLTYNQNVSERFDVRFSPGSERRWSRQDRKNGPLRETRLPEVEGRLGWLPVFGPLRHADVGYLRVLLGPRTTSGNRQRQEILRISVDASL